MEYLRRNTATGTPVANLLINHFSAVDSEIPRPTLLPVDKNCLYVYQIPALVRRDIEALKAATDSCVVLWDPSSLKARAAEFSELIETVRRFYQFEARFGAFEVWRRRPGTTESVFVPRPQISARERAPTRRTPCRAASRAGGTAQLKALRTGSSCRS